MNMVAQQLLIFRTVISASELINESIDLPLLLATAHTDSCQSSIDLQAGTTGATLLGYIAIGITIPNYTV
jgi:hypothetical protein